jgi:hypothetical protein
MEVLTDLSGLLSKGLTDAIVAILVAGFLLFMWHWFRGGYKHLAGMLEERRVSKRTFRTKKRLEAQAISDGVTQLLTEYKTQGLLNDKGMKQWKDKFKSIGLHDAGEETSFGKPFHYQVTHAMKALHHRLINKRKTVKKEDKSTVVYCD